MRVRALVCTCSFPMIDAVHPTPFLSCCKRPEIVRLVPSIPAIPTDVLSESKLVRTRSEQQQQQQQYRQTGGATRALESYQLQWNMSQGKAPSPATRCLSFTPGPPPPAPPPPLPIPSQHQLHWKSLELGACECGKCGTCGCGDTPNLVVVGVSYRAHCTPPQVLLRSSSGPQPFEELLEDSSLLRSSFILPFFHSFFSFHHSIWLMCSLAFPTVLRKHY